MTRIALLFDLDGTLIDSDPLHHRAFVELLAEFGKTLSYDDYRKNVMGRSNTEIMAALLPGEKDPIALARRKEAGFRTHLPASVPPLPGVLKLLGWAEAQDAGIALVTNAPRANADAMLAATGLGARIPVVIAGEDSTRAKPDPEPYRNAMQALGVTPAHAVAFEDSRSGLRAARSSGTHVFGLTTSLDARDLLQAGAHQVIADYTHPALWIHLQNLKARAA